MIIYLYPPAVGRLLRSLLTESEPKDILAKTPPENIILLLKYLREHSNVFGIDLSAKFKQPFETLSREELKSYAYDAVLAFACVAEFEHSNELVSALLHMDHGKIEDGVPSIATRTSWEDRVIMHSCGSHKIRLRDEKKHWLPVNEVLTNVGKTNSRENSDTVRICLQELSRKRNHTFEIEGNNYTFSDLFGFFQHQSNYTYYVNPIAIPLLMTELSWHQKLPNDGIKRISVTEMTKHIFRNVRPGRVQLVRDAAIAIMAEPQGTSANLIGYYNVHGGNKKARIEDNSVMFIAESLEETISEKLNLAPFLPEDKKHFQSENYILKTSGFFGYARMRPYYRQAVTELIEQALKDERYKVSIGFYRNESAQSYFVDPSLRDSVLTDQNIIARAKHIEARNFTRESDEPQARPVDKQHWVAAGTVAEHFGLRTPEARNAAAELLKNLYKNGDEDIGFFRLRGAGSAYYMNPVTIPEKFTRAAIEQQMAQCQQAERF